MKEIKAVVQAGKLLAIREALVEMAGFPGMTVTHAEGCSPATAHTGRPLSIREELTEFSPKVRIEIVAPDEIVDTIIQIIRELAHTGRTGDGVVWVTQVEEFHRLRGD
ncbi:MAG: P-II family nitrogen regulator [Candidatus Methylumidiphilus sp.]